MRHDTLNVLKSHDVLALWEAGASLPLDRVMDMFLSTVLPVGSAQWIENSSVGKKSTALIRLYQRWFGEHLLACVDCESCGETLEVNVNASDLLISDEDGDVPRVISLDDGAKMHLPRYSDLRKIDNVRDEKKAVLMLLRSCLLDGDEMCDEVVIGYKEQVEQVIEKYDHLALIDFELKCDACGHVYQSVFDIGLFLMKNMSSLALKILHDVHSLARHYGWNEDVILNMSVTRRKAYMEMIGA